MLTVDGFAKCIRENMAAKGYSEKRAERLVDDYRTAAQRHKARGHDEAKSAQLAVHDVFTHLSREAQESAKRHGKMLTVQAENIALVRTGADKTMSALLLDGKRASKGVGLARAAMAKIASDPRFSTSNYTDTKKAIRGQLFAIFGETLETVGKGFMGRQKGKAHLPNIVREIQGVDTGDAAAKSVAEAWLKVSDLAVDLFNGAGGTMNRLDRYLPQGQNAVKLIRAGFDEWARVHQNALDWNRTRWPDGSLIDPADRMDVLRRVYETLTTDGANKIDPKDFRGRGRALGNMIDDHRFLHYKSPDAWLEVHNRFGDGSVFDVMVNHIETMAHKIATIETFGPNPEMTAMNLRAIVRHEASKFGGKDVADADAVMKSKFDPAFTTIMRENPMDPHSVFGNLVTGASNVMVSAMLGSASFLAIPGDFIQTAAVRALNKQGLFDGVGMYVKALATDPKFARQIATQSGFVMDEVVMSNSAMERFTGVATVGPAATRVLSEATMRASLLSGHTRSARWAVQAEFMGMMQRQRDTEFENLPWRQVAERYGITKAEWDALRKSTKPWSPRADVEFMRPIDILQTKVPNRQALYRKFQGMIYSESHYTVPDSTVEAATLLRGTTRPDTVSGALLYSFSMFKNFPVSFQMIYGRLGVTSPSVMGRIGFYAGLGAAMTGVGALGTQLREISKGRDPLPMDNAAFLGKAFLSGGAMSIWGDFLFTGVNEYGRGPAQVVGGPLTGLLGDTMDLALGETFQWASTVGTLSTDQFGGTTAAKGVEFARRYTPGTSIWWARLALERHVFDRLQEIADPKAYRKQANKVRARRRDYGQEYWWAPGQESPARAPQFGG